MSDKKQTQLVRVRPDEAFTTKRNLNYFPGISAKTAGTTGLSMMLVRIPPGGKAEPHYHDGFEAGIYILEGRGEQSLWGRTQGIGGYRERRLSIHPARRAAPTDQPERYRTGTGHRLPQHRQRTGTGGAVQDKQIIRLEELNHANRIVVDGGALVGAYVELSQLIGPEMIDV